MGVRERRVLLCRRGHLIAAPFPSLARSLSRVARDGADHRHESTARFTVMSDGASAQSATLNVAPERSRVNIQSLRSLNATASRFRQ